MSSTPTIQDYPALYTVQEACKRIGISRRTMLRYEAAGMFPSPRRNQANGYRLYTDDDILRLRVLILGELP